MKPLILDGFRLEHIKEVMEIPDNSQYVNRIKRNDEPFNPNDHQVMPQENNTNDGSVCHKQHSK